MANYEDFDDDDELMSILDNKNSSKTTVIPKKADASGPNLQILKKTEETAKRLKEEEKDDEFSFKKSESEKRPKQKEDVPNVSILNKRALQGVNDRYDNTLKTKKEGKTETLDDLLDFIGDMMEDKGKGNPKGNTPNSVSSQQQSVRDPVKTGPAKTDIFDGLEKNESEDEDAFFNSEYFAAKAGRNLAKDTVSKAKFDDNQMQKRERLFGIKKNDSQTQLKLGETANNDQFASTKASDFGAASTMSAFNPSSTAKEDNEKNEEVIGTIELGKTRRRSPLGRVKEKVAATPQESQEEFVSFKRPTTSPGTASEDKTRDETSNSQKPPIIKRPNTSQAASIEIQPQSSGINKKDTNRSNPADDSSPLENTSVSRGGNQQSRGMKKMADFSSNKNVATIAFEKEVTQQFLPENAEKATLLEQINLRKTAELEDFKSHLDSLRKAYEDQIKIIKENHQKDLDFERKAREHLLKEMEEQVKRERQRNSEILEVELRKKDELNKLELDEAKRKHLIETDSLKSQIEHQVKLIQFSDDMRQNTEKLQQLSQKLEVGAKIEINDKLGSMHSKELMLQDMERRLKIEKEGLELEKSNLQKRTKELLAKEERLEKEFLKDKEQIRKEYQRLTELQEELRNNEEKRKKEHESAAKELKLGRESTEKERANFKIEMDNAWRELRLKQSLLDQERREVQEQLERNDILYREKVNDLEGRKAKMIQDESDLFRRKKVIEAKEFEVHKLLDEYQTKADHLNMERVAFEKEARRVQEIARKVNDESSVVNKIIRNYDLEKDAVHKKEEFLETYARTLDNEKEIIQREKHEIALKQRTLDQLRFNYVKELDSKPDLIKKIFEPRSHEQKKRLKISASENQNLNNKSFAIPESTKHLRQPSPGREVKKSRYQQEMNPESNASFVSSHTNEVASNHSRSSAKGSGREVQAVRRQKGHNNSFDLKDYMRNLNSIEEKANKNEAYLRGEMENLKRTNKPN